MRPAAPFMEPDLFISWEFTAPDVTEFISRAQAEEPH